MGQSRHGFFVCVTRKKFNGVGCCPKRPPPTWAQIFVHAQKKEVIHNHYYYKKREGNKGPKN